MPDCSILHLSSYSVFGLTFFVWELKFETRSNVWNSMVQVRCIQICFFLGEHDFVSFTE